MPATSVVIRISRHRVVAEAAVTDVTSNFSPFSAGPVPMSHVVFLREGATKQNMIFRRRGSQIGTMYHHPAPALLGGYRTEDLGARICSAIA